MFGSIRLRVYLGLILAFVVSGVFAQTLHAQAGVLGQWQTLPTQAPINPIHVALMHNGKVLIVSGSGNLPSDTSFMAAVYDPVSGVMTTQPVGWDMFCNGMVVLPDGRPFVMGGTLQYDPFNGELRTSVYDPATGLFADMEPMAHGRWYPTGTVLSDGTVMVFSGLTEVGATNTAVEIYKVGSGWSQQYVASWTPPLYPRMHVLPNGNVFNSGPQTTSAMFNTSTHTWNSNFATTNYNVGRVYGSSVLFPLTPANGYKPEVMIMGGGNPSVSSTEIIDLSVANPKWVYGPNMSQPRIEMNATILPSGKILVTGGSYNDEDGTTASLNADLYDPNPNVNAFTSAGANVYPRLYHSNSLLLPDATVLLLGSNPSRGTYEPHLEVYSPAYLFNADGSPAIRPSITSVSQGVIGYAAPFQVQTPDAANITSAVLIRAGAVTHSFDMDQRMVGLTFTAGSGVLNVTSPPNSNIAPPGYYLLFILNSAGVPSVASFVNLSSTPADQPPTGIISQPASNPSVGVGASVFFSGSGTDPDGSIASYKWVFPGGNPSSSTVATPGNVIYSELGTYVASLTVTDNQGVTDPSPETRIVTVGADFSQSTTPSSQTVAPGAGTTFTSTVTPGTGFSGVVSFAVQGLPTGATPTFTPATVTTSGQTVLSIATSSSVVPGSYSLNVVGSSGGFIHSNPIVLVVSGPTDNQPPTAPTNLTATAASSTQINLSWTASTDNVGVTGYKIERCQGSMCSAFAFLANATLTTYSDTALLAGTSYSYRVRATDAAGNLSGYSNIAGATTSGAPPPPTIRFIQVNYATPQSTVGQVLVPFNTAQNTGDLNVVVVGWNDTNASVTSVVDSSGNTYTQALVPTSAPGVLTQTIFFAQNIPASAAGANTVTVNFNPPAFAPDVRILEYSGLDPINPLDVTAAATGSTITADSGPTTTTNANDLLFGANTVFTGNKSAGTGYTSRVITVPDSDIAEDQVVTATGSYHATAPLTAAGPWIMQLVAFKAMSINQGPMPTAPQNLTASASSPTQINLAWSASTETGGTISQYLIERCQGASCTTFAQIGTSTVTSYTDSGLTGSISYSYRVRATDTSNTPGPYSNIANATTAPPIFTAPTNLSAAASGPAQMNLSWTAATETGGTITQYLVERCQGSGCATFTQVGTSTTNSYSDNGLTGSTSYTYRVRATDAQSNLGPYSTTSSATTPAPTITAPSNLVAAAISNTQINLTWTASTETGGTISQYLVERCQGSGCSNFVQVATSTAASYSDTGLLAATSYSYRVRATDALNNLSTYSNTASATTPSTPPPPPVIAFVQVNSATPQSSSAQVTVAYTKAQQIGDLNVVVVGWNDSAATVSSVTDTLLNTYTLAVGPTTVAGTLSQSIYYAKNIAAAAAGANTVTVKFSPAASAPDIRILEYSGLDPANPLDVEATATGSNTAADSGAATTLNANDLLFGANTVFTGNKSAGTGYTKRIITVPDSDIAEDRVVTATGSYHATATLTSAGAWVMQLVTFKAAGTTPTPTAPGNLTATAAGPVQVNLSWTASTETGGTISQYLVERCQGSGCSSFAQIGTSTTTSYSDTGLAGSTSYSYRVRAADAQNNLGPYSAVATVTTAAPTLTAPAGLTAAASSPVQVNLSWTASTELGGTISQYLVERCKGTGCTNFTQIGSSATTLYTDTGLIGSTTYSYRVRATDVLNDLSPYSNTASATTATPTLTPPSSLTATPSGSTQVNLAWTASTETGGTISQYLVERCQGTGCTSFAQVGTSTTTTYSDTGVAASTSYNYRVRATDASSDLSSYSNTASATTPANSPTAPGNLTATPAGPVQNNLSWTASTETGGTISEYLVERCQGAGCTNFVQVGTSTTTTYSDTGLLGSTTYTYRVRAMDATNVTGPYSNTAAATTAPPTLTAPSNLAATPVSGTQIDLSWTASTETGGTITQYLVERCQGAGCSNFAQVGTSTTVTYNDPGLAALTSYSYRVRAMDASSNLGPYSNTASAATQSAPPPPVITFVQVNSADPQTSPSQVIATYAGAQTAGDLNIVVVGWNDSTAAVTSVTDTAGNTYTLAVGPTAVAGTLSQSIYYAKNVLASAAGANSVTVNFSPAASFPDVRILEYGGLDPTSPLDVAVAGTGSTTTADSGAATTLNANDLLFGANTVFTANKSAGTGYTSRIITAPDSDLAEDEVVSATGSYHATATLTSAGAWVMQLVAFKAATTQAGLAVSPRAIALTPGKTQQFTASSGSVTWSVNGIAGGSAAVGTISAAGLYTPPSVVGSYTVTATTTGAPTQSASATAYLTNYPGTFTWHNDVARTGQNVNETVLTPSNVTAAQFGKLFSCALDASSYTQPLYVPGLSFSSVIHNVVFSATENDSVYAFDADGPGCNQLWQASLLDAAHGAAAGATAVPPADTGETGDIAPVIGITGTPVIDPGTNTLYVVSKTKEGTANYVQRLHALSLFDGTEKFGGPVSISASVPGTGDGSSGGNVSFSALRENQRPALLLLNGQVYIAWASHGDNAPYHGWVIAYNAATLQQTAVFITTPNGSDGGIWQGGAGPAADTSANIYVVVGNGSFDTSAVVPPVAPNNDFGQSLLKLGTSTGLVLTDFFTLFNFASTDSSDFDFGSGGTVVLPDSAGSTAHPHLALAGDKQGNLYLVDRDNMGQYCPGCTTTNTNIVQQLNITTGGCITCGIFQTAAVWQGNLYIQPVNDVLKAFSISNAQISSSPTSQSLQIFGFPGATPAVSAQGATGGIVWVIDSNGNGSPDGGPNGPAVLHAYDALNVATELWNSSQAGARDTAGNAVKFVVPTVANGKVFIGTQTQVTAYGLLP